MNRNIIEKLQKELIAILQKQRNIVKKKSFVYNSKCCGNGCPNCKEYKNFYKPKSE